MTARSLFRAAGIVGALCLSFLLAFGPWRRPDLWWTPDQRGDRLMRDQKPAEAAKAYADPVRQGTALYRAGDFKEAASAFAHAATPDAIYNRANSLVFLGKYADAVKMYDRALTLRPGWKEAEENRALAVVRRDRLKTTGGDEDGGQLKPDEIVFEKGGKKAGETVQVDAGPAMSDQELQALWLQRVQTKPADFLRAKFAFQVSQSPMGGTP